VRAADRPAQARACGAELCGIGRQSRRKGAQPILDAVESDPSRRSKVIAVAEHHHAACGPQRARPGHPCAWKADLIGVRRDRAACAEAEAVGELSTLLTMRMRLPNLEEERQRIYRAAIAAILSALGRDQMDEDAAAALWALVHKYLPYRIERRDEVAVEWSEEDAGMLQPLDQKWLADIKAQGQLEGALPAKRAWPKEDIARRFGAVPPKAAARIDGAESGQPLARTGTNRPR
jgi:hypothetical protein